MSKKKDPICLEVVVVGHDTKDDADKEAIIYTVRLQTKVTSLKGQGQGETVAKMTIKSTQETIFDDMPLKSERKIQLVDEQTTLE